MCTGNVPNFLILPGSSPDSVFLSPQIETNGSNFLPSASFASHNRTELAMSKAVTGVNMGVQVGFSSPEGRSVAEESGVWIALLGVAAGLDSDGSTLDVGFR